MAEKITMRLGQIDLDAYYVIDSKDWCVLREKPGPSFSRPAIIAP